jgi:hypothetical protein
MAVGGDNCKQCPDFLKNNCDGKWQECICRRCPRNIEKCMDTKYCTETESVVIFD